MALVRAPSKKDNKKAETLKGLGFFNGSPAWARTTDKVINSHLLYQLSYRGLKGENVR